MLTTINHPDIIPDADPTKGPHVVHFYVFTSVANMNSGTDALKGAVTFDADDVGRVARVGASAPYDWYILSDDTVPTWDQIDSQGGIVGVSANDTTPGFLLSKVVGGEHIVVSEINDGGDEDLEISAAIPVSRTLFLENPLTADDDLSFFTTEEIVISELRTAMRGGTSPSVTFSVRFGPDPSLGGGGGTEVVVGGTVTTNNTTGDQVTVFTNGTIPANSHVWLELSSVTTAADAPQSFAVTVSGTA